MRIPGIHNCGFAIFQRGKRYHNRSPNCYFARLAKSGTRTGTAREWTTPLIMARVSSFPALMLERRGRVVSMEVAPPMATAGQLPRRRYTTSAPRKVRISRKMLLRKATTPSEAPRMGVMRTPEREYQPKPHPKAAPSKGERPDRKPTRALKITVPAMLKAGKSKLRQPIFFTSSSAERLLAISTPIPNTRKTRIRVSANSALPGDSPGINLRYPAATPAEKARATFQVIANSHPGIFRQSKQKLCCQPQRSHLSKEPSSQPAQSFARPEDCSPPEILLKIQALLLPNPALFQKRQGRSGLAFHRKKRECLQEAPPQLPATCPPLIWFFPILA